MKTETRFTKIKYDGAKVRIEYEVEREGKEPDEYSLFSADAPSTSFQAALGALREDVIAICELPADQMDKLHIRGVSISHTNGIMGACITALKTVQTANAPLVLNSPHLPSAPYSDNPEPVLPPETCERLRALMAEAQKYIDGERAQGNLFADVASSEDAVAKSRVLDAASRLVPDGCTSVTMSSGGRSVTITPETAKALRKAAKELREHAAH
jgi:hypothetical protein